MNDRGVFSNASAERDVLRRTLVHLVVNLAKKYIDNLLSERFVARDPGEVSCEVISQISEDRSKCMRGGQVLTTVLSDVLNPLPCPGECRNLLESDLAAG